MISSGTSPEILSSLQENEWVELFPSGIAIASHLGRPLLILKDKHESEVLPVWMHPLDAGVALAELTDGSGLTPHAVTKKLLEHLAVRVESCTFVELIGHHQYVQLNLAGAAEKRALKIRADEAMSFCLQAKTQFFANRRFMAQCRSLNAELGQLEHHLATGHLQSLKKELESSSKKHPYVM